jgi:hypothetical protein
LGSIITICFESCDVANIGLAGHATTVNGHLDSTAVVQVPLFFVAVQGRESGRIDPCEQNPLYPGTGIGNDVWITVMGEETLEPRQFGLTPGEIAPGERVEDTLTHQGAVNE